MKLLNKLFKESKLQAVEPSDYICKSYINKSESNLMAAKLLLENNMFEESTSLVYYSMYNLVLALMFRIGIKSENHSASIFLLKEIFGIDNKDIKYAKRERIDKQYYTGFKVIKNEVEAGIILAEDFSRDLNGFILGLNNNSIKEYKNKFLELLKWIRIF